MPDSGGREGVGGAPIPAPLTLKTCPEIKDSGGAKQGQNRGKKGEKTGPKRGQNRQNTDFKNAP